MLFYFNFSLYVFALALVYGKNKDIQLTKKLVRLAKMLEIPILDHIIFSDLTYFSFKENKLI